MFVYWVVFVWRLLLKVKDCSNILYMYAFSTVRYPLEVFELVSAAIIKKLEGPHN